MHPELIVEVLDDELEPTRAHPQDGGLDLRSGQDVCLAPGETHVVPTGVRVAIPTGWVGLLSIRSGLAAKSSLILVNSPGIIDSGYAGEVKAILSNIGSMSVQIARGHRVVQLVVVPCLTDFKRGTVDEGAARGQSGFGSTDV